MRILGIWGHLCGLAVRLTYSDSSKHHIVVWHRLTCLALEIIHNQTLKEQRGVILFKLFLRGQYIVELVYVPLIHSINQLLTLYWSLAGGLALAETT